MIPDGVHVVESNASINVSDSDALVLTSDCDDSDAPSAKFARLQLATLRARELLLVHRMAVAAGGINKGSMCYLSCVRVSLIMRAAVAVASVRCLARHPFIAPFAVFDPRAPRIGRLATIVASLSINLFTSIFLVSFRAGASMENSQLIWAWGAPVATLAPLELALLGFLSVAFSSPLTWFVSRALSYAGMEEWRWRFPYLAAELARREATEVALEGVASATLANALCAATTTTAVAVTATPLTSASAHSANSSSFSSWCQPRRIPPGTAWVRRQRLLEARAAAVAADASTIGAVSTVAFGGADDATAAFSAAAACDPALLIIILGAAAARGLGRAFSSACGRGIAPSPRLRKKSNACPTIDEDGVCACAACAGGTAKTLYLPAASAPRLISCDAVRFLAGALFWSLPRSRARGAADAGYGCSAATLAAHALAALVTTTALAYTIMALLLAPASSAVVFLTVWASAQAVTYLIVWPLSDAIFVAFALSTWPFCAGRAAAAGCATRASARAAMVASGMSARAGAPGIAARLRAVLYVAAPGAASGLSPVVTTAALTPLGDLAVAWAAGASLTSRSGTIVAPLPLSLNSPPTSPAVESASIISSPPSDVSVMTKRARIARPGSARRIARGGSRDVRGLALPANLPHQPAGLFSIQEREPSGGADGEGESSDDEDDGRSLIMPSRHELVARWYVKQRLAAVERPQWIARLRARSAAELAKATGFMNNIDVDEDGDGEGEEEEGGSSNTTPHPSTLRQQNTRSSPAREAALRRAATAALTGSSTIPKPKPAPLPYNIALTDQVEVSPCETPIYRTEEEAGSALSLLTPIADDYTTIISSPPAIHIDEATPATQPVVQVFLPTTARPVVAILKRDPSPSPAEAVSSVSPGPSSGRRRRPLASDATSPLSTSPSTIRLPPRVTPIAPGAPNTPGALNTPVGATSAFALHGRRASLRRGINNNNYTLPHALSLAVQTLENNHQNNHTNILATPARSGVAPRRSPANEVLSPIV